MFIAALMVTPKNWKHKYSLNRGWINYGFVTKASCRKIPAVFIPFFIRLKKEQK